MQDNTRIPHSGLIRYQLAIIFLFILPACLFGTAKKRTNKFTAFGKYNNIVFEYAHHSSAVKLPPGFADDFSDQLALLLDREYPDKFKRIKRTSKHLVNNYVLVSVSVNSYLDLSNKMSKFRSRFLGDRLSVAVSVKDGFTGDPIMKTIIFDSNKKRQVRIRPEGDIKEYIAGALDYIVEAIGEHQFE
ncbi:MAG: hypothetical protein ACE5GM_06230 [bacterium]